MPESTPNLIVCQKKLNFVQLVAIEVSKGSTKMFHHHIEANKIGIRVHLPSFLRDYVSFQASKYNLKLVVETFQSLN